MTRADLEKAVLHLPLEDRAHLVQLLLESLDQLPEAEARSLWLIEAQRRADEVDQGKVTLISGEELEEQVQTLLK